MGGYSEEWEREIVRLRNLEIKDGRLKWEEYIRHLFPIEIPSKFEWINLESILKVLAYVPLYNIPAHIFLPTGGGLELFSVERVAEEGCIGLSQQGGCVTIMKPKNLTFYSFGEELQWAYFRLESDPLKPAGIYEKDLHSQSEELTELGRGVYEDRSYWEEGNMGWDQDGEIPLPQESRLVSRRFSGSYVIFGKYSDYNLDNSTYDARHNRMTPEKFREYIDRQYIR
ncbi:hypothetical protein ACDZ28_27610 [Paenibacillus sp. RS8]|uniref:hypothetical protein n=1 Tax=Paenibacillus sp. RS8 TaxID=3242681 RepID=UPI0035C1388B